MKTVKMIPVLTEGVKARERDKNQLEKVQVSMKLLKLMKMGLKNTGCTGGYDKL